VIEERPSLRLTALMWIGVTAAPVAVVVELVSGVMFTDGGCSTAGRGLAITTWTLAVGIACGLVALGGVLAALATVRATRDAGEAPPLGRVHFLGVVGIVVSLLPLAIIVMTTIGTVALPECVQS
jgi:hypothetical protein